VNEETNEQLHTEGHDPKVPQAWADQMRTGWGDISLDLPTFPGAAYAAERRARLADAFRGECLVLPAGTFKVRSNDTDYRFRADTAHTYFSGNQTSDAVLVIDDGEAVLYARPRSDRDSDEFFRDRVYGELWVGRRPSLGEISDSLGLEVRHIQDLPSFDGDRKVRDITTDEDLARVASEMRMVKDDWEIGELQEACDITTLGFEDSVREWDRVLEFGERWVEGTFFRRARAMGNDIGYDSIVGGGGHATTLHWIASPRCSVTSTTSCTRPSKRASRRRSRVPLSRLRTRRR
jgi:Xaa-Pro aminopeptidase